MPQSPTKLSTTITSLTTTDYTPLFSAQNDSILWHLHANNVGAASVLVEIHKGDITKPAIETLIVAFMVPPLGTPGLPYSLNEISLEPGSRLYAKAALVNALNVVVNAGER